MKEICERHNVLKISCEICDLENEVKRLRNAFKGIINDIEGDFAESEIDNGRISILLKSIYETAKLFEDWLLTPLTSIFDISGMGDKMIFDDDFWRGFDGIE